MGRLGLLGGKYGSLAWGIGSLILVGNVGCGSSEPEADPLATQRGSLVQDDACRLLEGDSRALMSAALELKLVHLCYGEPESAQQAPPGAAPNALPGTLPADIGGSDVLVNNPSLDTGGSTQSETSIVAAGDVVCAAWNDAGQGFGTNGFSGFGYSLDGGQTFTDGGAFPAAVGGDKNRGDPSLAYSVRDNTFYYAALSTVGLSLWRSANDCQAFTYVGPISMSSGDDKELMAVDNTPSSPFYGRIYVGWTDFSAIGDRNKVIHSDDGGLTWSAKVSMSGTGSSGQGMWPAVAPNGDVYFALLGFTGTTTRTQWIYKSTDGGNTFTKASDIAAQILAPREAGATSACNRDALKGEVRNLPSPQIAITPDSGSPLGYVVHAVYPYDSDGADADASNVFYRRSIDGAASWQAEVKLNDDATTTDQFFPALGATPSGEVGVSWYDRRLDPDNNLLFDRYFVLSTDNGTTFGVNERVSDVSSPVAETLPNFDGLADCYHGDYDQVATSGSTFHILWSDDRRVTSSGPNPDVYYDQFVSNPSKGRLAATPTKASCAGAVSLTLSDEDLAGRGSESISVTATNGDAETLLLTEVSGTPGSFSGNMTLSGGAVTVGDGVLQGADGVAVTFTYNDTDDGSGNPANASAGVTFDCAGPAISNVATSSVAGTSAIVTFTSSEPATARVDYGLSCANLSQSVFSTTPSPATALVLSGLTKNTTYFYAVAASDGSGNETEDDNGGSCYAFTTKDNILSEDFESGLGSFSVESGLWHAASSCASLEPGHSAPGSLYYGQDSTCNFATGARTFGAVRSAPLTLSETAGTALQFNYFIEGETSTGYDRATAEITVNGGTPIIVASNFGTGVALQRNAGAWREAVVDLMPHLGSGTPVTVEVIFRFDSVDSVANAGEGFLVDDVQLVAASTACTSDAECDDGIACTTDVCEQSSGVCSHQPDDVVCNDGLFCNGAETCGSGGCQAGTAVACADGVSCTADACDESSDSCVHTPSNSLCDNGLFCDGAETCDAVAGCQAGTAVVCADSVECTLNACDEDIDACASVPDDSLCNNGSFCDGAETCDATLGCTPGLGPCSGSCDETQDQCVEECQAAIIEAEGMFHSTGGSVADGWNIWSNGYISTSHEFAGGNVALTVVARGSAAGGAWPHMRVRIAEAVVYETDVQSEQWASYSFSATVPAGAQDVRIEFTNDLYQPPADRNLYVDNLSIDCESDTCSDGQQGGDETDLDCGGAQCPACSIGADCILNTDCQSQVCDAGVCVPAPSCSDGVQNGAESDVDCGGSDCNACPDGGSCILDVDCQSSECQSGVCQPVTGGDFSAALTVSSAWDGGYCATLNVTNGASQPTTSWAVTLNTNQSTIYNSWNGTLSGNSGDVTVGPVGWNSVLQPGATGGSVGFCANRALGSSNLPLVVSATAAF